jgi:hypothetical protein
MDFSSSRPFQRQQSEAYLQKKIDSLYDENEKLKKRMLLV